MPYTFELTKNPRGYKITNGIKTLSWTAEAPHVIQPLPDDGSDAWLDRAARDAAEHFTNAERFDTPEYKEELKRRAELEREERYKRFEDRRKHDSNRNANRIDQKPWERRNSAAKE